MTNTANKKPVWLEDKLNLLTRLITITRTDFVTVIQLMLLIFMAGMMYFGYQYLNKKLDSINTTVNPVEDRAVIQSSQRDVKINKILDDLRVETEGDRTKLFQFHNGQRNLKNLPFLYASVTHERVGAGVSSEIQNLQRIPSSIFAESVDTYLKGSIRCISPNDPNTNDAQRSILDKQRIKNSCSFAVFDHGDIVGFVTVNYVLSTKADEKTIDMALRKASIRIGDVLGGGEN